MTKTRTFGLTPDDADLIPQDGMQHHAVWTYGRLGAEALWVDGELARANLRHRLLRLARFVRRLVPARPAG